MKTHTCELDCLKVSTISYGVKRSFATDSVRKSVSFMGTLDMRIARPAIFFQVEEAFERDWARLCHPITQPIDK